MNEKLREAALAFGNALLEEFGDEFWNEVERNALDTLVQAGLPPGQLTELQFDLIKAGILAGGRAALVAAQRRRWIKD